MNRKFGALSSSVDPSQLALTVQSAARLVLAVLVSLGIFGTTGADTLIEQIPALVAAGFATYQGIELLWGITRKIIVAYSQQ